MARLAAISIDVDSTRFYRDIHGLAVGGTPLESDPIYTVAVPRFFALLAELGVPATLFLVGADAPAHAAAFTGPVAETRSEVASHSWSHDYRLSLATRDAILSDLSRADEALRPLNGGPLSGFRAPGYNVTPALLEAVQALGYRYDSSLLPSPLYFAARWAAIQAHALRGRRSASLPGNPRQFGGPLEPYRTSAETPWRPGGPLLELPMAVEPLTRTFVIGTSWVLAPALLRRLLLQRLLAGLEIITFELHAIDLLDPSDSPLLVPLAEHQPELRIPAKAKLAALRGLFTALAAERETVTLRTLADRV